MKSVICGQLKYNLFLLNRISKYEIVFQVHYLNIFASLEEKIQHTHIHNFSFICMNKTITFIYTLYLYTNEKTII